tara:strand:- start:608 stop:883 length:276 start_codon:yes stop_codon:yes gene_type:complete
MSEDLPNQFKTGLSMKDARKAFAKMAKADEHWQTCKNCKVKASNLERHHPKGRRSPETVVHYIYLCRGCHAAVHANPAWAESQGLLERNRS